VRKRQRGTVVKAAQVADAWQPVTMGDNFFLQQQEAGFLGLEVMDGAAFQAMQTQPAKPLPQSKAAVMAAKAAAKLERKEAYDAKVAATAAAKAAEVAAADEKKKSKKKKKKNHTTLPRKERLRRKAERAAKQGAANDGDADGDDAGNDGDFNPDVADAWSQFFLHTSLRRGLHALGFTEPSPIQQQCLPAAINKRVDILAAAETGSGKTLAFGIPVLHRLLERREIRARKAEVAAEKSSGSGDDDASALAAAANVRTLDTLIVTPTRELASQIVEHLQAVARFADVKIIVVMGGMSMEKQIRQLTSEPDIVVGTPGRLWELIQGGHAPFLADVSGLRSLCIDEADRMVSGGHFKELQELLKYIRDYDEHSTRANEIREFLKEDIVLDGKNDGDDDNDDEEGDKHENDGDSDDDEKDDDDDDDDDDASDSEGEPESPEAVALAERTKRRRAQLQTFLFSATMTIDEAGREAAYTGGRRNKRRVRKGKPDYRDVPLVTRLTEDGLLPLRSDPAPALIDLSAKSQMSSRLTEYQVQTVSKEKDTFLYYFLATNAGKTLVFVNSISCLRRVLGILKALHVDAYGLHSQMQQRARLKALDRFKSPTAPQCVLVCTDVVSRGIDIPDVRYVVHYQLPRASEIYVHRSGRTARAGATGTTLALVDENDSATYRTMCDVLRKADGIAELPVDRTLCPAINDRVKLATKLAAMTNERDRARNNDDWVVDMAVACGLDVDDGMLEGQRIAEAGVAQRGKGGRYETAAGVTLSTDDEVTARKGRKTKRGSKARAALVVAGGEGGRGRLLRAGATDGLGVGGWGLGDDAGVALNEKQNKRCRDNRTAGGIERRLSDLLATPLIRTGISRNFVTRGAEETGAPSFTQAEVGNAAVATPASAARVAPKVVKAPSKKAKMKAAAAAADDADVSVLKKGGGGSKKRKAAAMTASEPAVSATEALKAKKMRRTQLRAEAKAQAAKPSIDDLLFG
jgi:ATP-dependent RNA helicase DDX24/MAK5